MAIDLKVVKELVESEDWLEKTDVSQQPINNPYELPIDWRIEFEERAAILEYDGGLSRENADRQALQEILNRIKSLENIEGHT